ncbi:MAG: hypothetical protein IPM36_15610 [Lewinellaceae bacterium]|nr:hypothetical protein [Lewinellaceae bacterium]
MASTWLAVFSMESVMTRMYRRANCTIAALSFDNAAMRATSKATQTSE